MRYNAMQAFESTVLTVDGILEIPTTKALPALSITTVLTRTA